MAAQVCIISLIFFISFFVFWLFVRRTVLFIFNKSPVGGDPSCFIKKKYRKQIWQFIRLSVAPSFAYGWWLCTYKKQYTVERSQPNVQAKSNGLLCMGILQQFPCKESRYGNAPNWSGPPMNRIIRWDQGPEAQWTGVFLVVLFRCTRAWRAMDHARWSSPLLNYQIRLFFFPRIQGL